MLSIGLWTKRRADTILTFSGSMREVFPTSVLAVPQRSLPTDELWLHRVAAYAFYPLYTRVENVALVCCPASRSGGMLCTSVHSPPPSCSALFLVVYGLVGVRVWLHSEVGFCLCRCTSSSSVRPKGGCNVYSPPSLCRSAYVCLQIFTCAVCTRLPGLWSFSGSYFLLLSNAHLCVAQHNNPHRSGHLCLRIPHMPLIRLIKFPLESVQPERPVGPATSSLPQSQAGGGNHDLPTAVHTHLC
jgi:hypothetical protein